MAVFTYTLLPKGVYLAGHGPVQYYVVADTEAERPASATIGDLCFTKDTNKLWKWHTSTWNDTAGQGGPGGVAYREFNLSGSGFVWSNMPLAATEFGGGVDFRSKVDLTNFTQVRLVTRVSGGTFVAGMVVKAQYSTDETNWVDLTANNSVSSAGTKVGAWDAIPAGAIGDVFVRLLGAGGNGTADPRFGINSIQVK